MSYSSLHLQGPNMVPDPVQVLSAFLRKKDGVKEKDKGRVEARKSLSQIKPPGFLRQTSVLTMVYFLEYFPWDTKQEICCAVEDT